MEGKIVVDGILASCYASVNHDLAHLAMAPIKWFPGTVQWVFGEDDGFSAFAKITEYLRTSMLPFQQINQHDGSKI